MIDIRRLTTLTTADLKRIASGYTSNSKYIVKHTDSAEYAAIELALVQLEQPYVKAYDHFDDETVDRYRQALALGYSFGAFDDSELLVGIVLAEAHVWNQSVWVWEFHVAANYRGQGIGRRLIEALAEKAHTAVLRTIVCETQNTNATAIQVYRQLGFHMEGIDISYYSNQDYPDGEIAVFMKRRV